MANFIYCDSLGGCILLVQHTKGLKGEILVVKEKANSRNKMIIRLVILVIVLVAGVLAYRYFSEKTRFLNADRYYKYGVTKFKEAQGIPIDSTTTTTTTNQPPKPIDTDIALEAINNFRQSVGFDEQRADSWMGMAEVYTKIKEFDKAIEVLEEASNIKYESASNRAAIWTTLGDAYYLNARYQDAVDAYSVAIKESPKNPIVALSYPGKVRSLLEIGNTAEIDSFAEWVRHGMDLDSRAENQHIYHFALGWTYETRGRLDQAMSEYRESMSYNDKYAPCLYRLALQEQEANLFFEPYLKLLLAVEGSTKVGIPYAPAQEALAKMEEQLANFNTAKQAEIHVQVANYYFNQDNRDAEKVEELYKKALETDPNAPASAAAYAKLAAVLLDTRVDEELESNAKEAVEMTKKGAAIAANNNDKLENYVILARAMRILEDFNGAVDAGNKAIQASQDSYKGYLEQAITFYEEYVSYEAEEDPEGKLLAKYESYIYKAKDNIGKAKQLVVYDREVEAYQKRVDRAIERVEKEKASK